MSDRAFGWALFALAAALRLGAAATLDDRRTVFPDSKEYVAVADNILAGKGIILDETAQAKRPPVYPVFLAAHRIATRSLAAVQVTQALLGGLACVLVFLLGRRLLDARAGAWGGVACAFMPLLVFTGPAILIEGLLMTLLLLEVWLLVKAAEDTPAWGFAAGAVSGVASLLHPGHALFLLAVVAFRRGRFLAPYLGVALAILLAWGLRNQAVLGKFVPLTTQSGYALYEAFGPEATGGTVGDRMRWPERGAMTEVEYDAFLRREGLRHAADVPRSMRLAVEKVRRTWNVIPNFSEYRSPVGIAASLAFAPALALFLVALWRWRRAPPGAGWVMLPVACYTLLHAVFIGSIRYRLAFEPFILLIAAWGLTTLRRPRSIGAL